MKEFQFKMPARVVFGEGKAKELGTLAAGLLPAGEKRILIVTGPRVSKDAYFAEIVAALTAEGYQCMVYTNTMPEPNVQAIDTAAAFLRDCGAKLLIAIGGGSPIDTAKAMAVLATHEGSIQDYLFGGSKSVQSAVLPLIAVPTTAGSGSEVTAASVVDDTEKGVKLSITHDSLIPKYAVIDPLMHMGMPPAITASTGMDALTHAIEAYVSRNASIISDAYAEKCIALVGDYLRTAVADGTNREARSAMAIAAVLGAAAFLNGGLGAVHGISQSIGGAAHTPHGITNAIMLPYVMANNLPGNLKKFAHIAVLLGEKTEGLPLREAAEKAVKAVQQLSADIRIPKSLGELGVKEEMFEEIISSTMAYRLLPMNPVTIQADDVRMILQQAIQV